KVSRPGETSPSNNNGVGRSWIILVDNLLYLVSGALFLPGKRILLGYPSYPTRVARPRIPNQERQIRLIRLISIVGDCVKNRLPRSSRWNHDALSEFRIRRPFHWLRYRAPKESPFDQPLLLHVWFLHLDLQRFTTLCPKECLLGRRQLGTIITASERFSERFKKAGPCAPSLVY